MHVSYNGVGKLAFIDDIMNAKRKIIELLRDNLSENAVKLGKGKECYKEILFSTR